jgi:glycosyltransferase involved in cell wall biosynthesis
LKIAFITIVDVIGRANMGIVQNSKRCLSLLKQAFGEENIYVCAITGNKQYQSSGNTTVFYADRSKLQLIKYALTGRRFFSKKIETEVLNHITLLDCDAVFFDTSFMEGLPKRLPKKIKQILFMCNIEFWLAKKKLHKYPHKLLFIYPTYRNESIAVKNADKIIALHERDADLLKKYYARNADLLMPITMDDIYEGSSDDEERNPPLKLLFVGAYAQHNVLGISWFIKKVMPHVNAQLNVVGKGLEKVAEKLTRDNVNILGTVDDLAEQYYLADAVVSPLLFGAGMKVKIAEAMMYGKPIFATDESLEGYDIIGQEHISRCNSAIEFISAINAYAERFPYSPFAPEVRQLFLEKYNTPAYIPIIKELLCK